MSVLRHGLVPPTATGYNIERSLRFNSADSAYLSRTPGSAGNRKTWTWSGWVKRGALGAYSTIFGFVSNDASQQQVLWFRNDDTLQFYIYTGAYTLNLITTQVFRDPSSWYHIVLAQDTTQATDTNRVKIYVNGTQVTAFSTASYPSQNLDGYINSTVAHGIGSFPPALGSYFNGYQADIHLIDGSALTPSSFGENDTDTGVWKPKAYTGSYGTNGFKLTFSDNSGTTATTLGKDTSGNGNNWTPNNFSVTAGAGNDSLVDTPTPYGTDTGAGGGVRGNYATLNPLNNPASSTLSNGNLDVTTASSTAGRVVGTIGVSSGKWYWEITPTSIGSGAFIGIAPASTVSSAGLGDASNEYAYYSTGQKYNNSSATTYGASYGSNDVIGVALDMDAGTVTFYKNGSSQGQAFSGITGVYVPGLSDVTGSGSITAIANFGQRPFAYTAPSGFKALCTTNLPTPTIGATSSTRANKYFDVALRTAGGSSGSSVTSLNFQPDFVWDKTRSIVGGHYLEDAVRGAGKHLQSNTTNAESTDNTYINAFTSNGFTVGSGDWTAGTTIVDWCWKANGAGSSNTAGSITSTVSANTTAGFSIVTYTGTGSNATVGHGLGVAPKFIIIKSRSSTNGWPVYSESVGNTHFGYLNTTDSFSSNSTAWNNTSPTSTVFTVGTGSLMNNNGSTYVAYCFAPVAGYSAFGSYTGNGSSDGPFVYTGFRPAYVMIKRTSSDTAGGNWVIKDFKRPTYNANDKNLFANLSNAETTEYAFDLLSNGFKIRVSDTDVNKASGTYIYAAFAEVPAKFSLAR